jgi:hypothetical protein
VKQPPSRGHYQLWRWARTLICLPLALSPLQGSTRLFAAEFTGSVLDSLTHKPIASRVYLQAEDGRWLFVRTTSSNGSALAYREQWVPIAGSVDQHTTVSAHPFGIDLPPGKYTLTVERGKEYLPLKSTVTMTDEAQHVTVRLKRWINMASRGWFSGETHVHRRLNELPNVMLAEDLNVAFPVTFWTTNAFEAPGLKPSPLRRQGPSPFGDRRDHGPAVIPIDQTHVMFPRNTEYEVFSVGQRRHVLGAVFILNHQTIFRRGMPPVASIAEQAHREGALLDLDKHSWPWALMLVPVAKVDLFELSNNSVWRTQFGFRKSQVQPAEYMQIESDAGGMTEWGWLNFGFETYYALLNCGFRLKPSAGTASGVHPVPLGFSRVYVHLGQKFHAQEWVEGLRRGTSFVTTGPMLLATLNNRHPGHEFRSQDISEDGYRLQVESISERPVDRIEVLVNGRVSRTIRPQTETQQQSTGGYVLQADVVLPITSSAWIAVRSVQYSADRRVRFAHTAPWYVTIPDRPLRPRKRQTDFLIKQVRNSIARNRDVLPAEAQLEYQHALRIYEDIARQAIREDD